MKRARYTHPKVPGWEVVVSPLECDASIIQFRVKRGSINQYDPSQYFDSTEHPILSRRLNNMTTHGWVKEITNV